MKRFLFSYHKCLTVFVERVFRTACARPDAPLTGRPPSYVHLDSRAERLADASRRYRVVSLNNHAVDLDAHDPCRAVRLVRDPRDLLVSGYHYHRRGAEPWCHVVDPTDDDWRVVNGRVPPGLRRGESFTALLQDRSLEDGLLAELDFRRGHFDSMLAWPVHDERVLLLRYEQVLGDEVRQFERVFDHLRIRGRSRTKGLRSVRAHAVSAGNGRDAHVRDPRPGQWRDVLTPVVLDRLESRHPGLLERYGYTR